jgi:hypothetical protein
LKIVDIAIIAIFFAVLGACNSCTPSPTPVVPTPDASDAASQAETAPTPSLDAAPPTPPTACAQACAAMQAAGCVVQANCAAVLAADTAVRRFRNPKTGNALTCAELAAVKTAADVVALGQSCGPPSDAGAAAKPAPKHAQLDSRQRFLVGSLDDRPEVVLDWE